MLLVIVTEKKLPEHFTKKNHRKTNQKVIKKATNYMLIGKAAIIL